MKKEEAQKIIKDFLVNFAENELIDHENEVEHVSDVFLCNVGGAETYNRMYPCGNTRMCGYDFWAEHNITDKNGNVTYDLPAEVLEAIETLGEEGTTKGWEWGIEITKGRKKE